MLISHNYQAQVLNPAQYRERFVPRYLDIDGINQLKEYQDQENYAYWNMDLFSHKIEIMNISPILIHIATRDGGISTLRNTLPSDLVGKKCYRTDWVFDHRGIPDKTRPRRKGAVSVPPILPGIYICIHKQVSISPKLEHRGVSRLFAHNEQGEKIYDEPTARLNQLNKPSYKKYQPFKYHQDPLVNSVEEESCEGDTIYMGEIPIARANRTRDGLYDNVVSDDRRTEAIRIDYFIPAEDIINCRDGMLYIEQLDICIATNVYPETMYHPYSEKGKLLKEKQKLGGVDNVPFAGMRIINVDNAVQKSVQNYYCNLGDVIIEIPPTRSDELKPGVYFYIDNYAYLEGNEVKIDTDEIYLDHRSACGHESNRIPTLYRSYQEAKELGDIKRRRELEYQEKIRENELIYKNKANQMELDWKMKQSQLQEEKENLKRLLEKQAADQKAEIEREAAERKARWDKEDAERKAYYEERSYQRKDDSETLKWMLGAGGLILGLAVGLLK